LADLLSLALVLALESFLRAGLFVSAFEALTLSAVLSFFLKNFDLNPALDGVAGLVNSSCSLTSSYTLFGVVGPLLFGDFSSSTI